MATKGVNTPEAKLYLSGLSIPQVSSETGIPASTLRFRFKKLGILRSRGEAVRIAAADGRLGSGTRGKSRSFSDEHKENMRLGALKRGEQHAKGTTLKPSGYVEYTRGPHKGKTVHVAAMEARLGRNLKSDEVVHHIDGNTQNNNENNLALCTRSGHSRLHRFEDHLQGKVLKRNDKGQILGEKN
tara:strand:+ start:6857 stop:7411 length:555 start_codon:yes stop_codon:yes gene_type:complete